MASSRSFRLRVWIPPFPGRPSKRIFLVSLFIVLLFVLAVTLIVLTRIPGLPTYRPPVEVIPPLNVTWEPQVDLNAVGYEPSISIDSRGILYYTAHKNLDDLSTWPYLASWFLISQDGGRTWASPSDPPIIGSKWKTYLGDEGDIAIDAQDNVYFVDTYLTDNHLHVWQSPGTWQYSLRIQKSTGLDDRPWIAAQGDRQVSYLGNNGIEVRGGRYWYYHSTNGGLVWTAGEPVPGNGWAHIDAERNGDHIYIVSESEVDAPGDILVYASSDQGRSFDWGNPSLVGHRDGPGRHYPIVSAGENGTVWTLWMDTINGTENGTQLYVGKSSDYGATWNMTNITPMQAYMDYPTIAAGPDGSLGVAFYGTTDLPVSTNSTWYVYGAIQRNGATSDLDLNFSKASEEPLYQGDDLHALHDFFEIAFDPEGNLNVAFQHYDGPCNGCSSLYFVRGALPKG